MIDLHRTNNRPDWENVPTDTRNFYQQVAADTRGIITPANLLDAGKLIAEVGVSRAMVSGHQQMLAAAESDSTVEFRGGHTKN